MTNVNKTDEMIVYIIEGEMNDSHRKRELLNKNIHHSLGRASNKNHILGNLETLESY